MPGAQQVTEMRAASMSARPISGQHAVAVAPERALGIDCVTM